MVSTVSEIGVRQTPIVVQSTEDNSMTQNVGTIDRVIRAVAGLAILSLVFVGPKSLWGLLGLVPLLTAAVGWCPPYSLLGLNTCKTAAKPGA
jgi:hypothetical protein